MRTSAKKRIQKDQNQSEEMLRTLINTTRETLLLIDTKGTILLVNETAAERLGKSVQELVGTCIYDHFPPELAKSRKEQLDKVFATGEPVRFEDTRAGISYETYCYPVFGEEGEISRVAIFAYDITARKRAEEALRESEEKFRTIFDRASDGILLADPISKKFLQGNTTICSMLGYTKEEIESFTIHDIHPPEDISRVLDEFEKQLKGEMVLAKDLPVLRKDGSIFYADINSAHITIGGTHYLLGIFHDITARKRAEEALKKSESLYKTFIDASNDMVFFKDEKGRYSIVNKGYLEYLGKKEEDVIGKTGFEIRPLQIAEQCDQSDRETLKLNDIVVSEEIVNDRTIETRKFPVRLGGNKTGIGGFMRDITENKMAAEKLLESEERYRSIFENAVEGIYQSTRGGRFIGVNPAMARIHGFASPEEMISSITSIGEQLYVNPGERARYQKILKEQGIVEAFEVQLYTKDRDIIWVSMNARAVRDTTGKVLYYEGIIENITKRKLAEEELKYTIEKLRAILNATVRAMAVTVETRDPYTAGHQRKVANLARAIAQEMNLFKDVVDGIRVAGLVHDIGKIAVPAEILSKPTKLTEIEFSIIKVHSEAGYNILKDIDFPWPIADIVLQHHERLDGSGYPKGLKGEHILLEAQILTVADVVEAMASHRPYRASLGIDFALEEIEKNKGTLYDKKIVDACVRVFREKEFRFE